MTDLQIVPIDDVPEDEVRQVIGDAFGRHIPSDWFRWKHLDGPWGPSIGAAVVDAAGVAGVRLLLPWLLQRGSERVLTYRAVEAATARRAQGQGAFSMLNRYLMQRTAESGKWSLLFSTPNMQSRDGYRKLGWRHLTPILHYYVPIFPALSASARIDEDPVLPPGWVMPRLQSDHAAITTAWDEASLRWRFDDRSGNDYRWASLSEADGPNGLVYRVIRVQRIPVLLVACAWGELDSRRELLKRVARRRKAPVALMTASAKMLRPVQHQRGESLVTVWENEQGGDEPPWPLWEDDSWALAMADIESVI